MNISAANFNAVRKMNILTMQNNAKVLLVHKLRDASYTNRKDRQKWASTANSNLARELAMQFITRSGTPIFVNLLANCVENLHDKQSSGVHTVVK